MAAASGSERLGFQLAYRHPASRVSVIPAVAMVPCAPDGVQKVPGRGGVPGPVMRARQRRPQRSGSGRLEIYL